MVHHVRSDFGMDEYVHLHLDRPAEPALSCVAMQPPALLKARNRASDRKHPYGEDDPAEYGATLITRCLKPLEFIRM